MTRAAAVLSAALAAAGLALATAGCGGEADPESASADGDTAFAAEGAATDSATAGAASADSAASAEDSAGDSRPLRARILRIVNLRSQSVVVTASAGLEAAVLDTVPAGDSAEVNVESRAPRVGLQALVDGRQVGADSLDLTQAEAARWLVPSEGGVSSRPVPGRRSPRHWR